MRKHVVAVVLAAVAALGASVPAAAAVPASAAKVVIIVGATHGATAGYRSNADVAYSEAIKHTSHVTKIYSPNATWSKVKAAVDNANIVIYFGHGNGWPSPYTFDPKYTTKDGMGLNADVNGDGKLSDYENKYYGEPYMAQLHLAPNAIVLLHNLCYASGNNESGVKPEPTVSVARQRIDNYAAGFIKGGARAVIADGHMGPSPYLAGLFDTSQSVLDLWRSMPNYHGHESSFASSRSAGYVDYSDPDGTASGFYRSLVTKPGLTTNAVTNAVGDTGVDPASLVVPGRAAVIAPVAPVAASASLAETGPALIDLPAGTRLKTVALASPASGTTPAVVQVQGLDDPSISGYVSAADLAPRDSRAPVLVGIDTAAGRLSPNGDDRSDEVEIQGLFSETVAWAVDIKDPSGAVIDTTTGNGTTFDVPWDGLVGGIAVPDGTYTWAARGTDAWRNGTATGSGSLVVDTVGVNVSSISPDGTTLGTFTPNADGVTDTISTTVTVPEAGTIAAWATDSTGTTVKMWSVASVAGSNVVTWDGRASSGAVVPDGDYTLHFTARDKTGTNGIGRARPIRSVGLLAAVRSSLKVFYPQDRDDLAPNTSLTFTLSRPATATWTIRNPAGAVVATHLTDAALPAGTQTWRWTGRADNGTLLPAGVYTSTVSATDGTFSASQSARLEMNAFSIATSTSAPKRGGKITVTATSAEALSTSVRLYVTQPGLATWSLTLTKVDNRVSKRTFSLKIGGRAGTVTFRTVARDSHGVAQSTSRSFHIS